MEKLRLVIEQHGRWVLYLDYVQRIEAHVGIDFSHCLENAKALLEGIGKEICVQKGLNLEDKSTINGVLKNAFSVLGYSNSSLVNQISSALATIGQQMGNLRNEIGPTAHGKPLAEMQARNTKVDLLTQEFLIDTTVSIAAFLIRAFEADSSVLDKASASETIEYIEAEEFNSYWDEIFGDFEMGDYSYAASEILYNVDQQAYRNEYKLFIEESESESENEGDESEVLTENESQLSPAIVVVPEPIANESTN